MIWEIQKVSVMSEADYTAWLAAIEPKKRDRILCMKRADDRRRSVCADHLVRRLVAEFCGCAPEAVVLDATAGGAPIVVGRDVCISISHSGDRVLCAASDRPIGVDIQQIKPVSDAMLRRVCTPTEAEYVGADTARFFEVWTFKEAVFKCRGTGFTRFADVELLTDPHTREYRTEDGYAICIVTE